MSQRRRPRQGSGRHAPRIASARPTRLPAVDALRGFALCLMLVYHFCFDLAQPWVGIIHADFNNDPFWLGFRALILSAFLGLVGVSLVLARQARPGMVPFWRRIALIVFCAALVTIASYVWSPRTFITFGILHCIAVASVLARPLVRWPRAALMLGIAVIAAGVTVKLPVFDAPWLNWVGMMTHKPATEDYVPLFPWLGVVLLGVAAGAWVVARERPPIVALGSIAPAWLSWLGRHSLIVYMAHQPVLVGILRVIV
jgi:uncharacterized membrane protein